MKDVAIFDLDGTLADVTFCRHFVVKSHKDFPGKRDFDAFHHAAVKAPIIEHVVELANEMSKDFHISIVTARKEKWRQHTIDWLKEKEIVWDSLFMREDRDHRNAEIIKLEILKKIKAKGMKPVVAVDDSPYNIDMFREQGLETILVPGWVD